MGERVVPTIFVSIFKYLVVDSMGNDDTWREKTQNSSQSDTLKLIHSLWD